MEMEERNVLCGLFLTVWEKSRSKVDENVIWEFAHFCCNYPSICRLGGQFGACFLSQSIKYPPRFITICQEYQSIFSISHTVISHLFELKYRQSTHPADTMQLKICKQPEQGLTLYYIFSDSVFQ